MDAEVRRHLGDAAKALRRALEACDGVGREDARRAAAGRARLLEILAQVDGFRPIVPMSVRRERGDRVARERAAKAREARRKKTMKPEDQARRAATEELEFRRRVREAMAEHGWAIGSTGDVPDQPYPDEVSDE